MNVSYESPEEHTFNRPVEVVIGSTLLICSVFGIPANLASFYYFLTKPGSSNNARYFNRVYSFISIIDCLICTTQIPVIHNILAGREEVGMFGNVSFCNIWAVAWTSLGQTSVFLVALLSVSRLCILMSSTKLLNLATTWGFPLVSILVVVLGLCVVPLCLKLTIANYASTAGMCIIMGNTRGFDLCVSDLQTMVPAALLRNELAYNVAWGVLLGLPIIPVSVSFALSLLYLRRAQRISKLASGSTEKQRFASATVIIVTLVYLVTSVPIVLHLAWLSYHQFNNGYFNSPGITYSELEHDYKLHLGWFADYATIVDLAVPMGINSALNPVLYFWRMRSFRKSVLRRFNA